MIELDLNRLSFQNSLFALEKADLLSVLGACKKLRKLTWEQLYQHTGFNWEWIAGKQYYTFRASSKIRIAALREGETMRLLEIFEDHDSAYN
jgi:hypothetical protein